jgi:hypothetical protein
VFYAGGASRGWDAGALQTVMVVMLWQPTVDCESERVDWLYLLPQEGPCFRQVVRMRSG